MEYWTAFTIGLLGSLHCIGMCGPIAFALPLNRQNKLSVLSGSMLYNFGRLLGYFFLGAVFGMLGKGLELAGFQRWLSILVGAGMILSIVLSHLFNKQLPHLSFINPFLSNIKSKLAKQFGRKSFGNLLSIGLLNAFLPCGLVYMGLAGATAMASSLSGGWFMFFFGLGTLPLMLSVSLLGNRIRISFRHHISKIIPIFILLIGLLFILRGMNLGIPYVSPMLQADTEVMSCH